MDLSVQVQSITAETCFFTPFKNFREINQYFLEKSHQTPISDLLKNFLGVSISYTECLGVQIDPECIATFMFNFFSVNGMNNWQSISHVFSPEMMEYGYVNEFYSIYLLLRQQNGSVPKNERNSTYNASSVNDCISDLNQTLESFNITFETIIELFKSKRQIITSFKAAKDLRSRVFKYIFKILHEIPNLHDDDNDDALMAAISGKKILEIADYEYGDSVDLSRINGEFLTNKIECQWEVMNRCFSILANLVVPLVYNDEKRQEIPQQILKPTKVKQISNRNPNIYSIEKKSVNGGDASLNSILPENVIRRTDTLFDEYIFPGITDNVYDVYPNLASKIPISSLDELCQSVFQVEQYLNVVQTIVFNTAYNTSENMLVCAPTSCGKTNIALLCILHEIKKNNADNHNEFKVVYVAPMKALATEVTRSLQQRLKSLHFNVRELTGDMQLTAAEICSTNIIVTTPEKWDAVSRKMTNETSVANFVSLIIFDEIHILNTDRGAVIESIVARTLRQVEFSQTMIRIVALSATLPNYFDIAKFLRVNPSKGLFYFDSHFRPVSLEQCIVGVRDHNVPKNQKVDHTFNEIVFTYLSRSILKEKQVMVFVHTRKSTANTANALKDMVLSSAVIRKHFEPSTDLNKMSVEDRDLDQLLRFCIGIHHAGLSKHDRHKVERLFLNGNLKVLVCTSTLAWGVNLPAFCVIIKGTEVYDSDLGRIVDLSILDVLQIFGRAGRPQFENHGLAVMITHANKLSHYLRLLSNIFPIESSFSKFIPDNLNAEIVLGTIANITDAYEWLKYTYLFVRMQNSPLAYGITYDQYTCDTNFRKICCEFIRAAAVKLNNAQMIRYDEFNEAFYSTDLGMTASFFYVRYETIEIFLDKLTPYSTESDIFNILSLATEFEHLKVRNEEIETLDCMLECCELKVPGGVENTHGKTNILLQYYLSNEKITASSLSSDLLYVSDNICRIARALFYVAMYKNYPNAFTGCLTVCKMFEMRQWHYETPLKQFKLLDKVVVHKLNEKKMDSFIVKNTEASEIARLIKNEKAAPLIKQCTEYLPSFSVQHEIQPITNTVIRIQLKIRGNFVWSNFIHGKKYEKIWIWITDPDSNEVYHTEEAFLSKLLVIREEELLLNFTIPVPNPKPSMYLLNIDSDKWLGCYLEEAIYVKNIRFPDMNSLHTDIVPACPLPLSALNCKDFEKLYNFQYFNPVQTQYFHILYHTNENVFIGAPTGSGKTLAAELAILRMLQHQPNQIAIYISPLKALVRERVADWTKKFTTKLNRVVAEVTGDTMPHLEDLVRASIVIITPEKLDGLSRKWKNIAFMKKIGVVIVDEIHLLGEDRGPILEVLISRINNMSKELQNNIRIIGLSTSIANVLDLAAWLSINERGIFNFRPNVRPVPLDVHISGYPGKNYCPRMMTMNKPVFQAICTYAINKPSLVFVSSRRQTRLTADVLVQYIINDKNHEWPTIDDEKITMWSCELVDKKLVDFLRFGIGIHHAGLSSNDRLLIEKLFFNKDIQILVATSTLAWGVNFPASLVVIKGTEYYDSKTNRYVDMPVTDILQMMGRAGRPQYDKKGTALILVHDIKKQYYKKFLYEPFPVESNLLSVIFDHFNAEIAAKTIYDQNSGIQYLEQTYFFRRLLKNPDYYQLESTDADTLNAYLAKLVSDVFETLINSQCVCLAKNDKYIATPFGEIASFYYISHKSILHIVSHIKDNSSYLDLLTILCGCHEFSEIPIRHNEEDINSEMLTNCLFQLNMDPTKEQLKTFVVLSYYLEAKTMPNPEYYTDLRSILDQVFRVLQAMISVCVELNYPRTIIWLLVLSQSLSNGFLPFDEPLKLLSDFDMVDLGTELFKSLPILNSLDNNCLQNLARTLNSESFQKIIKNLEVLPKNIVRIDVKNKVAVPNEQFDVEISLVNRSKHVKKVSLNSYVKAKEEIWHVFAIFNKKIVFYHRSSLKTYKRFNITVNAPLEIGSYMLQLYVMSDAFLGLNEYYDVLLTVDDVTN